MPFSRAGRRTEPILCHKGHYTIMKFLRKLALLWLLAWLPISGVMAATMPFCAQGMMGAMQLAQSDGMQADESQSSSHCDPSKRGAPQVSCEHCDLCHIAGAILPPSMASTGGAVPPLDPADTSRADFSSFFPDLLPRPPARPQT